MIMMPQVICPLLRSDQTAAFLLAGANSDMYVDGDLGRADADDAETVDEAADDQHVDVLGRTDDDGADDPVDASI